MHDPEGGAHRFAWGLACGDEAELNEFVPVTYYVRDVGEVTPVLSLIEFHNQGLLGSDKLPASCVSARKW